MNETDVTAAPAQAKDFHRKFRCVSFPRRGGMNPSTRFVYLAMAGAAVGVLASDPWSFTSLL
jgi:hypothetical protein